MENHENHLATVREYITAHLGGKTVPDNEDLFTGGHLNSLFAVQIVVWLEKEFGIAVRGGDLTLDNFRSIGDIAAFIGKNGAPVG
ncbi:acyl carrier protein [Amycolatopsis sp. 195334CR]|uniref:acyl carrier protein n=1 Tax=Amycolatopsis sp. 195334CR TaxID=2814588 RepID=UPI001A8C678E|nr:acyl carrier protein [Amycolatopsis sp. 195334CR]MBN6042346.1 acyl carrier protein [Amycolatopsis sp. 195334CR]